MDGEGLIDEPEMGVIEGKGSINKLKEIMRRQRRDSETTETPDLEFIYADCDSFPRELSELFTYSEVSELNEYRTCFNRYLREKLASENVVNWSSLSLVAKRGIVVHFAEMLEVVNDVDRLHACMSLLYLALGAYTPGIAEEELLRNVRFAVFLMLDCGVFPLALQALCIELDRNVPQKSGYTIAQNKELRVCLSLLYVFVECLHRKDPSDSPFKEQQRLDFIKELRNVALSQDSLTNVVFTMLLRFCSATHPHYPIKKIVLLIWKVILATLGGLEVVEDLKKKARSEVGLPPIFEAPKDVKPITLPLSTTVDARALTPDNKEKEKAKLSQRLELVSALQKHGEGTDGAAILRKGLEFQPKAHQSEVDAYIKACEDKFVNFDITHPGTLMAGLPGPILESIKVLQSHVYRPLSEIQIKEQEDLDRKAKLVFGKGVPDLPQRETATEDLYHFLIHNLTQYMISLLKVLLAASPTAKVKSDSLNILIDVLPVEEPATVIESSSLNLDIQRHKEIIVKAVSAILLLLLKHFKLNHIYQYEFMSQHLVFANCIPLVLKFFNQNVMQYVSAKNMLIELEFFRYVTLKQEDLSLDSLEPVCSDETHCWRNLFASINLLRVLQKLTKWKHSRVMMMVVFKSAPILKRALKVKHPLVQLYALKLLKAQTKYLGRNWRKSNMKVISSIYQTVRHHLHDDWAYGNDLDAKPWDFQTEEVTLRDCVDRFNLRYYGNGMKEVIDSEFDFTPVDNDMLSVLNHPDMEPGEDELENLEDWLEHEVFNNPTDWNLVLENTAVYF